MLNFFNLRFSYPRSPFSHIATHLESSQQLFPHILSKKQNISHQAHTALSRTRYRDPLQILLSQWLQVVHAAVALHANAPRVNALANDLIQQITSFDHDLHQIVA